MGRWQFMSLKDYLGLEKLDFQLYCIDCLFPNLAIIYYLHIEFSGSLITQLGNSSLIQHTEQTYIIQKVNIVSTKFMSTNVSSFYYIWYHLLQLWSLDQIGLYAFIFVHRQKKWCAWKPWIKGSIDVVRLESQGLGCRSYLRLRRFTLLWSNLLAL